METHRPDRAAIALLLAASGLTSWALLVNNITLATNDYTLAVFQAVAWAWSRSSRAGRTFAVVLALAAGWTLFDAAVRRLPAVLGW